MRSFISFVVAATLSATVWADATIQQKTQMRFGGAVGSIINVFGRSATHEGVVSETVVHKNRKSMRSGDTGEIVDLGEEKIYYLDYGRQTYKVVTFDELRRQYEEAKARAKREAPSASKEEKSEGPEMEVEFSMKSTGNKETINGWETREEIASVTVHEKGKKLEESGGFVLTSDMWIGPRVPAMRELTEFERKFVQKLYGNALYADMQQAAAMLAATPAFAKAMKKFSEKKSSFDGTPIRTKMTFESVAGTNPNTDQQQAPTSALGGLIGRMKQRRQGEQSGPARSTMLDSNSELLKASTSASADAVAMPAGFKQR
jgi:hypothetical protein